MKGKRQFSPADAEAIRRSLAEIRRSDRAKQKRLRGNLRAKYRFYITDFDVSGKGFTADDFDALVADGKIIIRDI